MMSQATNGGWRLGFLAVLPIAVVLVSPSAGRAQTFNPIRCTTCLFGYTTVTWTFSTNELPSNPFAPGDYTNYLHYNRILYGNHYIDAIRFHFTGLDVENGDDYVTQWQRGVSPPDVELTGNVSGGFWTQPTLTGGLQRSPVITRFQADESGSASGFNVDQAQVCCTPYNWNSTSPAYDTARLERNTGILLGTNDVVYHKFPVRNTPSGTVSLILWSDTPNADFDVYVRCGAKPQSGGIYNYSSNRVGTSQEFMIFSEPGVCSYPGTWWAAVHSRSGDGVYNLVISHAPPPASVVPNALEKTVGFNFYPSANTFLAVSSIVQYAARAFYGVTEGQQLIRKFRIYRNSGSCDGCPNGRCDICFHIEDNGSLAGHSEGDPPKIDMWQDPESPYSALDARYQRTLMHEFGHSNLLLFDEYDQSDPETLYCGHSIMGRANAFRNNNLCIGYPYNSLYFHDHMEDSDTPANDPLFAPSGSAWWWAAAVTPNLERPLFTPDNYEYVTHDFRGVIENILYW